MEAIGRLSGGVAHDFNNLLGVIIGYCEILQDRIHENDPLRINIDEILKAGNRGASLTRQLLAFSRQQVLEFKVIGLNSVVSDMEKMLHRLIGEDIELCTILDPEVGRIKADHGQLEQVILNLTINARDAMPSGGKLLLMTSSFEMDDIFVQRYPYPVKPGSYVKLTVSDTGIGMDAATQAHIFEPFFTTKEKGHGTGLGLSTVYGVVKQSGGYIEVQSARGAGTTFVIYMPMVEDQIQNEFPVEGKNTAEKGIETILLVEDEPSLRESSKQLLEMGGYTVIEAADGDEALQTVREYDGRIHLLLTDIVMPGMTGHELAQKLVYQRPELQVILMSGYTGKAVGDNESLGQNALFLQKPFTRDMLRNKVLEALNRITAECQCA
jgi:CheY-like chemotaxis protein